MNIAEKIWYTWLVLAVVCFVAAFVRSNEMGYQFRKLKLHSIYQS